MATNMELAVSYPPSKFEADNTIANPTIREKYQLSADIVNGNRELVHNNPNLYYLRYSSSCSSKGSSRCLSM